jgi:hypothetical protein
MKLTSIDNAPYVNLNSLIHIVNTGDTTQSPDGSSYKTPLSTLSPLFGGSGDSYWSASTGTNAIVLSNSNSLADGINAVAEGVNTTANGYASKASGVNTKALAVTSFVHSSNSTVNAGASRSIILGGQSITATAADTVYVPNLNINTTPANDNALTQVLVRATDGTVKYRDSSTINNQPTIIVIDNSTASPYTLTSSNILLINRRTTGPRTEIILPSSAQIGSSIEIIEDKPINGRNMLRIRGNTGQVINVPNYFTTSSGGAFEIEGDSDTTTGDNISLKLTCLTSNTRWGVNYILSDYLNPPQLV